MVKGTSGRGGSSGGGGGGDNTQDTSQQKLNTSSQGEYSSVEALEKYQGEGSYRTINKNLRKDKELSDDDKKVKKAMDKAMTPLEEKTIVYRGMGNSVGSDIAKAGVTGSIKDKGFTSTSFDKAVPKLGSYGSGWQARIVLPKGTKAINVNKTMGKKSAYKEEKELIVKSGTSYGIMKVNQSSKTVDLIALKPGQDVASAIMGL